MPIRREAGAALWILALATPQLVPAQDINFSFYASARIQAEAVRPDVRSALGAYEGFRDAYSRIGFNADYPLPNDMELFGQLELPLDLANQAVQDPWDQDESVRIARIGIAGDFGRFSVGQMWMPFYNAIAYPVDRFSSYYSGFATYTSFRLSDTIAFDSPEFNGLSFSGAWSRRDGAPRAGGTLDERLQLTASYRLHTTVFSVGVDDLGGEADWQIFGASVMHNIGPLDLGAKIERHNSRISDTYGADGDTALNVYAGYTSGRNTFKLMLANVERFGEDIVHLGMDHWVNYRLMLFAEYYYEEETAAITARRAGRETFIGEAGGGQVFLTGMHFSF
jgi:predicted porin